VTRTIVLATIVACGILYTASPSFATPPPEDSDQYKQMEPYKDWLLKQRQPPDKYGNQFGCCSVSDCRIVDVRTADDGLEAFIGSKTFSGAPDKWLKIPGVVMLHDHDPEHPPFPVACWSASHSDNNGFYCFSQGVVY
jgi:hypothetical protein